MRNNLTKVNYLFYNVTLLITTYAKSILQSGAITSHIFLNCKLRIKIPNLRKKTY